jgi:hypothetical protein
MPLVLQTESFLVFDDVLSAEARERIWAYLQQEEFEPVHAERWKKVWRLSDGVPYRGSTVIASADGTSSAESSPPGLRIYPTHTGIDTVIGCILAHADDFGVLLGTKGLAWDRLTATAALYPQQTRLSWHLDGGMYAGAYIYYAHREWNAQWGGELLIADLPPDGRVIRDHLDNARENELILERGTGRYIMAKPNRLVILKRAVLHQLNRVDSAAGDHVRCTVSGFFLAPALAGQT